jgi:nitroreductase
MLICYDSTQSWKRKYDGADSGWADASIAATHMMLEAHELGVGSCWVMYFDPQAVRDEFNLPSQLIPVALLVMGYPAPDAAAAPLHDQTKPLEELVTRL